MMMKVSARFANVKSNFGHVFWEPKARARAKADTLARAPGFPEIAAWPATVRLFPCAIHEKRIGR